MQDELPALRERGRGIDIIPERVRAARRQAALTLADLAAGKVTSVAIHMIETGKSRPSASTLMHIAQRTHQPIAFFTDERHPAALAPAKGTESVDSVHHLRRAALAVRSLAADPKLIDTERIALRALQVNLLESIRVVQAMQSQLAHRERTDPD